MADTDIFFAQCMQGRRGRNTWDLFFRAGEHRKKFIQQQWKLKLREAKIMGKIYGKFSILKIFGKLLIFIGLDFFPVNCPFVSFHSFLNSTIPCTVLDEVVASQGHPQKGRQLHKKGF